MAQLTRNMNKNIKDVEELAYPYKFSPTLVILCFLVLLGISLNLFRNNNQKVIEDAFPYIFSQESFLVALSNPANPPLKVVRTMNTIITAYSSTPGQTDDTPFTTASNKTVKDGIVANNSLPFGTQIRIPELYGEKVFVVEDRMSRRKSDYHFDIWFPEYEQALVFGAERTYVEVLGRY